MDCNWCNCVRGGFICTRNSCGPATFPPPAGTIPALSTFPTSLQVCLQPKDPGNCYGFFPRYYFNSTMKRCEYFIYGGCGGNQNNFESLRDSWTSIPLCDVFGVVPLEDQMCRDAEL
ncbi:KappaPI-actitoxin-Avd3b [Portunus trituberculatus]|uniref:KappaPI-actitoxin-Avd3b n=1 Tax=Portunus trituberculatus TaxID=210409 RepID=A0A5B7J8K7_PORTR|nr:KappaPI-actitoxin-Avd3b [Portunus trituberculatus]